MKKRILFLCNKNSFRSQACAAWVNALAGGEYEALSAGPEPASALNPLGLRAMELLGVDMSSQRPRAMAEYLGEEFDYVITVCAPGTACPVFTGKGKKLHWDVPNPPSMETAEDYQRVCLAFKDLVERLPGGLG